MKSCLLYFTLAEDHHALLKVTPKLMKLLDGTQSRSHPTERRRGGAGDQFISMAYTRSKADMRMLACTRGIPIIRDKCAGCTRGNSIVLAGRSAANLSREDGVCLCDNRLQLLERCSCKCFECCLLLTGPCQEVLKLCCLETESSNSTCRLSFTAKHLIQFICRPCRFNANLCAFCCCSKALRIGVMILLGPPFICFWPLL